MVTPSAGVHVTLPDYYSPENLGMIVPKTKDGRVVFMLPWKEATIAGTTGRACASKCSFKLPVAIILASVGMSNFRQHSICSFLWPTEALLMESFKISKLHVHYLAIYQA